VLQFLPTNQTKRFYENLLRSTPAADTSIQICALPRYWWEVPANEVAVQVNEDLRAARSKGRGHRLPLRRFQRFKTSAAILRYHPSVSEGSPGMEMGTG